ncbi:MAG: single-stranded DNA-binding protein [Candidatus Bipolaricaulota bacterium]
MPASVNKVFLLGNLASDPDPLKYSASGAAKTRFRLAVGRSFKDSTGQAKDETTFVTITVWGSQAEHCAQYLSKGRSVFVEGRLRISAVKNEETEETKWYTEVVASSVQFLGSPTQRAGNEAARGVEAPAPAMDDAPIPDEEVPF